MKVFNRVVVIGLLFLGVLALRFPFLSNPLVGEEGSHAYFVVSEKPSSALSEDHLPRLFAGSVEGVPILIFVERTIVPYWIIEKFGRALAPPHIMQYSGKFRTIYSRLPFLFMFFCGSLGTVLIAACSLTAGVRYSAALSLGIIAFVLTTPLMVGASIQPQVDGSVGVMLLGIATAILCTADPKRSLSVFAFILAGVLAGLGKHEWTLAFAGAVLVVALLKATLQSTHLFSKPAASDCNYRTEAYFLLGIFLGAGFSIIASPSNYVAGFDVMNRIYTVSGGQLKVLAVPTLLHLTLPVFMLGVISGIIVLPRLRRFVFFRPGVVISLIAALVIILGFALSGWGGDGFPRYFAPPFIILATVCVVINQIKTEARWRSNVRGAFALAFLGGVIVNLINLYGYYDRHISITSFWGASLSAISNGYDLAAVDAKPGRGVATAYPAIWLYHPDINFITPDMGPAFAQEYITARIPDLADKIHPILQ